MMFGQQCSSSVVKKHKRSGEEAPWYHSLGETLYIALVLYMIDNSILYIVITPGIMPQNEIVQHTYNIHMYISTTC